MESVNTMRAILVAFAVLATIVALVFGLWTVAVVMTIGIAAHSAMWLYVRRSGQHPTVRPDRTAPREGAVPRER